MIPGLDDVPGIPPETKRFLAELRVRGFSGDIADQYSDRLTLATDNSIYQCLPEALLFPRHSADIELLTRLADESFPAITFTPRGGGTGTNGQSLNHNVIVDLSRYMHHIIEINIEERWVIAQAGVVKDQLNDYLKPFGFFFSPELSTSNRATLGGMINTDASGQGSLVYGKTSDHVIGLSAVLVNGEAIEAGPMSAAEAATRGMASSREGHIYRTVVERCRTQRALILEKFPQLNRFLTGYDLRHVYSDDLTEFNLSRILAGSEGSLALITAAKLNITPIPQVRRLINVKYDSFDAALRNATFMVEANALSVETVDSTVLNLAREDIVWHSVSKLITDIPGQQLLGLNMVEFAGDDEEEIDQRVAVMCERLNQFITAQQAGVIGWQLCTEVDEIERIYAMRKKAVGLLGNARGRGKPVAFVEDTCVPPEKLADYIAEFRALLDKHELRYGMFGHVDAGVLHVRPALDLTDPQHEILHKHISDEVVALTGKYGGLLWGEHGKGFRAEYSPEFFGPELYQELRSIKTAFDPLNRLNPGKICPPLQADDRAMFRVDAVKRGTYDRQIPVNIRTDWRGPLECNGNGLCFNYDTFSPMCPSWKITQNRLHSPKGRATMVREWLRLLAEKNIDPATVEASRPGFMLRLHHTLAAKRGRYDFSHEVKAAMSGCLACKACSTQCPVKIDVPDFRSRFLQLYHTRYLRPLRDHIVAAVESYTPLLARIPRLTNLFLRRKLVHQIVSKTTGMVDLPLLSVPTLKQRVASHPTALTPASRLFQLSEQQRTKYVVLIQDPFTSFYDAKVVEDAVKLITHLGFHPVILPFTPNGKAQHVKGFLQRFAHTASLTSERLNQIARLNIPMVGVDPALVLCFRDEYQRVLGDQRGHFTVALMHEWLRSVPFQPAVMQPKSLPWYLFTHCTEATALPGSAQEWAMIFAHFGARLEAVNLGCCGMAGTYGHERINLENSRGIYSLSWQRKLESLPAERCLSTGYSCRSQVKRFAHTTLLHPLQALLDIVAAQSGGQA
ncbi:D-2-hydroxyglutarate dehydrogenase YdiJ [Pantoea sp. A4]|uniref:D-2-hydroxyglutarate dehydrogenase YdiJ n=1 Tax=Pantoea sp. A4 TaxID=1225184 RepID=UPI00037E607B|nr:FAD-binding and (Fe-S)-binding domain-containing protein [Pantoea sp. A4]